MGVKAKVVDWFNKTILHKAEDIYEFETPVSQDMITIIGNCARIYGNKPMWLADDIQTVNVSKIICSEIARLVALGLNVTITGSTRAEWLQSQIDTLFEDNKLRDYIEYCMAYGTLAFKPNGEDIDIFKPNEFIVVSQSNGQIDGIVFFFKAEDEGRYFTRLERHELKDDKVYVTNKAYEGRAEYDLKKLIPLTDVEEWADIKDEWDYESSALFSVLKVAGANNFDSNSPLGLPVFANTVIELEDYDIGYSRWRQEVKESEKIVLLDSDRMLSAGRKPTPSNIERQRELMKLPHYVRNVFGDGTGDFYQEINPQLNTSVRLEGLNHLLSFIGYKCGFDSGHFSLDKKTGLVTATQVEADDRRTIELIKDNRDSLKQCIDQLIEALNNIADAYKIADSGSGSYEVGYDFEDITHNVEEDRNRWYSYVISGQIPFWYFLVKFEGMTEEEAKSITTQNTPQLFNEPSSEPVEEEVEEQEEAEEEPSEEKKEVK